ncbi:MAG TPA: UDP-N-acetylmuramoyl-L-alanyl-D-glutamate--2,6-diaminopimelate ligase [Candidatus Acidoferrales bacterium]|nr:UDP-N-acetylmuramoyl-L-alanyl-D-glutamate--2,6-diaminopimelate ligase [Candidatus Acidoferrales bacterium]
MILKVGSVADNGESEAHLTPAGAARAAVRLAKLLRGTDARVSASQGDVQISGIAYDSRRVDPGTLFVAIHGEKTDGNRYASDAVGRGAVAIISEQENPGTLPTEFPWVQVAGARKALAISAANFYLRPAEVLKLIGVTGTNGKTTTSYLVDSILRAAGCEVGLLGTIGYRLVSESRPAPNTTPESLDLQRYLAEIVRAGGTHAVLEASSHALAMDRLWGCPFAVAIFTNLTRDHLDYHKTFEEYFAAKRRLFEGTGAAAPSIAVLNRDDEYGQRLLGLASRTLTYGLEPGADVTTRKPALSISGIEFVAETPAGKIEIRSKLVGRPNVYNILGAIGAGVALALPKEVIATGIAQLSAVPGRFERIDMGQPFLVIVDFAHTDDALRNLLATAKELNPDGRIVTLFGCGGDRDRTKRPLMGEAAGHASDIVVLTSDNPRSEDPLLIINDVIVGVQRTRAKLFIEPDRQKAIEVALDEARSGDIVLLAGKGHETYQVLRDRTIELDDREVARAVLRRGGFGGD